MSEGKRYAQNTAKQAQACELYQQGKPLDYIVKTLQLDFYRLRVALDRAGLRKYREDEKPPDTCPCGKKTGVPGQKFCSHDHRMEYGRTRQANPDNYVTFNCLGCGEEITRYKKYGKGYNKYCSNECAAKHTRTKQHIVVDDAVVLDSGYEALFWGLCSLWKLPVERADRSLAVRVGEDGWYCPDFWLPTLGLYVETKGFEDDDDRARYAAWQDAGYRLRVLDRDDLLQVVSSELFLSLRSSDEDAPVSGGEHAPAS